jgi:hypothetical protein
MSFTEGKLLATIPRSSREELRVMLSTFKGRTRCDVRVWYRGEGDEFLPGKGVSILPNQLAAVLKALSAAQDELGAPA